MTQFYVKQDNGRYRVADASEVSKAAAAHILETEILRSGMSVLTSPEATRSFLTLQLGTIEHEVFGVLFLDNRHRVIEYREMFQGTIDSATVHPREVVKAALKANAAAVILVHNHPSGNSEPSQADIRITTRLKEALNLIDIRVLDHVIVAGSKQTSLAERGLV